MVVRLEFFCWLFFPTFTFSSYKLDLKQHTSMLDHLERLISERDQELQLSIIALCSCQKIAKPNNRQQNQ